MITTVEDIRDVVKGLRPETLVYVWEGGFTIMEGREVPVVKVKRRELFRLLDNGLTPAEVARRLGVSRQAVSHTMKSREAVEFAVDASQGEK